MWLRDQEERTRDMKEILNCVTPKVHPEGIKTKTSYIFMRADELIIFLVQS